MDNTELLECKTEGVGTGIEHNILEVRPQRGVGNGTFGQGLIDLRWTVGGAWAWVPNRSYVRMAVKVSVGGGGAAPKLEDNIALADNVCGSLYNNAYFRAGQQDVSSIVSYLPQASQVKNRITKSGAWTRTVGASAYGQNPSFASRINNTASDGTVGGAAREMNKVASDIGTVAITTGGAFTLDGAVGFGEGIYALQPGDVIHIEGQTFTVQNAGTTPGGANSKVFPVPSTPVGATANFLIIKANATPQRQTQYVHWVPPIGIFDSSRPMGSGDYTLSLNPAAKYKSAAVQALSALTAGTDYDFEVIDLSFFVSLVRVNVPPSGKYIMDLTEFQIQTKPATSAQNNQLNFSVPPSTYALAVYVQGNIAGSSTQLPPSVFKTLNGSDAGLENIQITYSNLSKPATNFTSGFTDTENYLVQRYHDTQAESCLIFNDGGTETFNEWKERGGLYFYRFLRAADDRSTHVALNLTHTDLEPGTNVHLCAVYRRSIDITTTDGRVSQVITQSL